MKGPARTSLENRAHTEQVLHRLARAVLDPERAAQEGVVRAFLEALDRHKKTDAWGDLTPGGKRLLIRAMFEESLDIARPYVAPVGVAQLLALTRSSGVDEAARLPFRSVWLDGEFAHGDRTYYGILATEGQDDGGAQRTIYAMAAYRTRDGHEGILGIGDALGKGMDLTFEDRDGPRPLGKSSSKSECRFLGIVLLNWLYLLESPQVGLETSPVSRRDQDILRRRGITKPPSNLVRLRVHDAKLLASVEAIARGGAHYSHAFEVSGYWKVLRHPRYKENVGKRIRVEAYVKGKGILVRKTRLLPEAKVEMGFGNRDDGR